MAKMYTLDFTATDPNTGIVTKIVMEVRADGDDTMNRLWGNLVDLIDPELEVAGGIADVQEMDGSGG